MQPAYQVYEDGITWWKAGAASALDGADIAESRDVGAAVAYSRRLGARVLDFAWRDGAVVDTETGSTGWPSRDRSPASGSRRWSR